MIPSVVERVAVTNASESVSFDISLNDSAHLMEVLRDTLYTDKILAVLREYASNAWDEHRMSGKGDVPIRVTLPSDKPGERFLTIRDFGRGMSPDEMQNVFVRYGASSKRTTDQVVGTLGVGCKSGFSYVDSFEVTSFHNGMKRTYVAVMDQSNKGQLNLLDEQPTTETGFEIRVAVKPHDVHTFRAKAETLFSFFSPRPDINIELPVACHGESLKSGVLFSGVNQWTAVMGCVPYRLDMRQIESVPDFVKAGTSGVLFFDIGEVQVSASREELRYSEKTKVAVLARVDDLMLEYAEKVRISLDNIEHAWGRRWKLLKATHLMPSLRQLPLFSRWFSSATISVPKTDPFLGYSVDFDGPSWKRHRSNRKLVTHAVEGFEVDENTMFVVLANVGEYKSYMRSSNHFVLVPREALLPDQDLVTMAQAWLTEKDLSGAPLLDLAALKNAYPPPLRPAKSKSAAPGGRVFLLSSGNGFQPASLPKDTPFILVPIHRFKKPNTLFVLPKWEVLAKRVGMDENLPVYGIKRGYYKPEVFVKYPKALTVEAFTTKVAAAAKDSVVLKALFERKNDTQTFENNLPRDMRVVFDKLLPKDHALRAVLLPTRLTAEEEETIAALKTLTIFTDDASGSLKVKDAIGRYPLVTTCLRHYRQHGYYTDGETSLVAKQLTDYIKMIDERNQ